MMVEHKILLKLGGDWDLYGFCHCDRPTTESVALVVQVVFKPKTIFCGLDVKVSHLSQGLESAPMKTMRAGRKEHIYWTKP